MGAIRDECAIVARRTLVYVVPLTTSGVSRGPATSRNIRVPMLSEFTARNAAGSIAASRTLALDGRARLGRPGPREATGPYRFSITDDDHRNGQARGEGRDSKSTSISPSSDQRARLAS
jgi:hypothetical protein